MSRYRKAMKSTKAEMESRDYLLRANHAHLQSGYLAAVDGGMDRPIILCLDISYEPARFMAKTADAGYDLSALIEHCERTGAIPTLFLAMPRPNALLMLTKLMSTDAEEKFRAALAEDDIFIAVAINKTGLQIAVYPEPERLRA